MNPKNKPVSHLLKNDSAVSVLLHVTIEMRLTESLTRSTYITVHSCKIKGYLSIKTCDTVCLTGYIQI